MIKLSLCMIVKNESDTLARCLDSVDGIPDEIIIVDTGSTDDTRDIARRYTSNVFDFEWIDDFSAARNFAFSKAKMDYIFWLDADDIVLPADRDKILELKSGLSRSVGTVMLRYNVDFDSAGNPTFSYYRERILSNCAFARWSGAVHEVIVPFGEIIYSDAAVCHKKLRATPAARNLNIYRGILARGGVLMPRESFYYARELYNNGLYDEACQEFESFLRNGAGWIENNIEACRFLAFCYYALKRDGDALRALLRSLEYDRPRAELCCDIGNHLLDRKKYTQAVYWFESALLCPRNDTTGAFVLPDCYGFIPCLQLCLCWHRLGDMQKSAEYNRRAGELKPDAEPFLSNMEYFKSIGLPQ